MLADQGEVPGHKSDVAAGSSQITSILRELGISAFRRGQTEVALKFMSRACAYPDAPAMWHRDYAEMLDQNGQGELAEAAARSAVRLDPDCAKAWETLGTILGQRGVLEESCNCYATAVRIDPTFAQAINNLAVALDRVGQIEIAETRYREALRLEPDNMEVQLNLANLLGKLGRYPEALEIAQKVLDCCPYMTRAHSLVAEFKTVLKCRRSISTRAAREPTPNGREGRQPAEGNPGGKPRGKP